MELAERPDRLSASSITRACARGLGTENALARPSWFRADPLMMARMVSPSARASAVRFNTTAPMPSPGVYPSASAPKLLQRPCDESIPSWLNRRYFVGCRERLTPPAIAMRHSLFRRLSHARCSAVIEEEQAESTAKLGPLRSDRKSTRLN